MNLENIKELLDEKYDLYNRKSFIDDDPVGIPHLFTLKEDIEISAFLSATIAWGQRKSIIKNAETLVRWMDYHPFDFVRNCTDSDLKPFKKFVHRTFNGGDCIFFLKSLQHIYREKSGLENAFFSESGESGIAEKIIHFRRIFFEIPHLSRTEKHVSNPAKNSSCKRLNLFLRWMVRKDQRGVDFGIWENLKPSELICPLDIHSGNTARKLGILKRKQNDWKAAEELTGVLRKFSSDDPVKYDFALFGLGIFEKINL